VPDVPDDFYSPQRVRSLLRVYPYMDDRKTAQDPELAALMKKKPGTESYWEEVRCRRADLQRAIAWLWDQWGDRADVIRLHYIIGMTQTEIAKTQRFHGAQQSISRWCHTGTAMMADFLGWVDQRPPQPKRLPSPTVIRYFEECPSERSA